MVYLAILCSLGALISGLMAVGSGRDWHFTPKDIVKGRSNALLYVWVVLSTIFSLAHAAMLIGWALIQGRNLVGPVQEVRWMALHSVMGAMFVAAHVFIKITLKRTRGLGDDYLWSAKV